jgi:D-tyrosyl-tRNA(Tyr) deacylase
MRGVVQRVARAEVVVDGRTVGRIERGLVVLLGVLAGDGPSEAARLAEKIAELRFFPLGGRSMERSALAARAAGEDLRALVVSQFTLAADGRKGRRPSFDRAARPEVAEPLYEAFVARLRALGLPTEVGVFGAHMDVALVNDGPVTFVLDELPVGARTDPSTGP